MFKVLSILYFLSNFMIAGVAAISILLQPDRSKWFMLGWAVFCSIVAAVGVLAVWDMAIRADKAKLPRKEQLKVSTHICWGCKHNDGCERAFDVGRYQCNFWQR